MRKQFNVKGMHCKSCERLVKDNLEELDGVVNVEASHTDGTINVEFDEAKVNDDKIKEIIKNEGHEVE